MAVPIGILPLQRMTPTLWSHSRLCKLRGLLAATPAAGGWVLHSPRAWLGVAFHAVMEHAARADGRDSPAEAVWQASIDQAACAAAAHILDARYSNPERCPGYFLIRQRALASAAQVPQRTPRAGVAAMSGDARGIERALQTKDGKLAGRPDKYDGHTVTDFKSSLPDPRWPGADAIVEDFRRQLLLYAVLIADTDGRWPARGRVVAASGQAVEFPIVPNECEQEAAAAVSALESSNELLASGNLPEALAEPSPAACGTCQFQQLCPAFWRWLSGGARLALPRVAAAAVVEGIDTGADGDLYTARLSLSAASAGIPALQSIVLRRSVHGDHTIAHYNAAWRIVSASVRGDGRLQADLSTVAFASDDLPALTVTN